MNESASLLVHATCVAIDGIGLLLRGPSGSGKSDLALRLIDGGAALVGDDYVELRRVGAAVIARPPANLVGMIEVRGIGILRLCHLAEAPVAAVFDLVPTGAAERMPEPAETDLLGVALPLFALDPASPSAPAKVRLAMRVAAGSIMRAP